MVNQFIKQVLLCIFIGIDCGSPGTLENGMVTNNGTYVTSVATFNCDFGYELIGDTQRVCQPDGTWSNMVPRCSRKLIVSIFCNLSRISSVTVWYRCYYNQTHIHVSARPGLVTITNALVPMECNYRQECQLTIVAVT